MRPTIMIVGDLFLLPLQGVALLASMRPTIMIVGDSVAANLFCFQRSAAVIARASRPTASLFGNAPGF
jgi:hypothetical protein